MRFKYMDLESTKKHSTWILAIFCDMRGELRVAAWDTVLPGVAIDGGLESLLTVTRGNHPTLRELYGLNNTPACRSKPQQEILNMVDYMEFQRDQGSPMPSDL